MDLNNQSGNVPELDLNRLPNNVHDFPSFIDIRIVCRRKFDCRSILVRKYGEEGHNMMLRMPEPMILSCMMNFKIILFVLYS